MSKLEVDKIDPQSGTDLELGTSGDTITIPTGVTLDASNATTTLPANVVTTDGTQTLTNKSIAATQLTGTITPSDGTVTNAKVNASAAIDYSKLNLTGNIALADLSATGTKDATTFLRGDNTFAEAGGGAYEKISTTTVSSAVASVDFETLSTDYRDFRFVLSGIKNADHQVGLTIRVKRSGQSSYDSGSSDYRYASIGRDDTGNTQTNQSTGRDFMLLCPVGGASPSGVAFTQHSFTVDFYDVHSTDHRIFYFSQGASMEGTYGGTLTSIASGYRNTNGALIGIQFKPETGNWSDGTFTIYGRKI